MTIQQPKPRRRIVWIFSSLLLIALAAAVALFSLSRFRKPLFVAEGDLQDGRILRIEEVSYGRDHLIGDKSLVIEALGPWLPARLKPFFQPAIPHNEIHLDTPGLVVWVNAVDPATRTNVDCQSLRMEFLDEHGTVFSDDHQHWFGGQTFWREGHVFEAFPRGTKTLRLKVTSWKSTKSVEFFLPNPAWSPGENWTGQPLPQSVALDDIEMVLREVVKATNNSAHWRSHGPYLKPEFEIWSKGQKQEGGWDLEWTAHDRFGNSGQELGIAERVLKFVPIFRPSATNLIATRFLAQVPVATIESSNIIWWNATCTLSNATVTLLGIFPPGVHVFSEGEYLTNPPVHMGSVRGGAPTGWTSTNRRETPTRTRSYYGHYTDVPVVYVRLPADSKPPLGIRLIDAQNRVFLVKAEPQGVATRIAPFLLNLPTDTKPARIELVLLPSFSAEFLVSLPGPDDISRKPDDRKP